MAYRRGNFDYVIDSSFNPFSFQELMQPWGIYKEAFEQTESAYDDLSSKADKFKYLSETLPEGSQARKIYEGYANELNKQATDLAKNGLSMANRRSLTNLKRRYQGEIGRLISADEAMQEERKLRRTMNAKDSSMLYAMDNLSIDDFMDGNTPNLYNISGTELYTRGAAAGKAASSRVYSAGDEGSTLNGYYRKWVERNGYSKESMDAFRANVSAIPELQQAADAILTERGVTENLTGSNLERARQSVINGIIDGSMYQEKVNPVRDAGVMSAAEKDASARGWAANSRAQQQLELSAMESGYKREGNKWVFDPNLIKQKTEALGIGNYNPDDWEVGPDGKIKKKAKNSTQTTEEKQENSKQKELLKLDKGTLANNGGFDVTFGNDRHHYNYIGAISRHGNKWYHGAIGDDNPGHNFPRALGWGSTSNVENAWGNFSAEGSDSKDMRVLSPDEMIRLVSQDTSLLEAIQQRAEAMGIDPEKADIQLIEVPNEKGGGGDKGYLIAVH